MTAPHDIRMVANILKVTAFMVRAMRVPMRWSELVEQRLKEVTRLEELLNEIADDVAAEIRADVAEKVRIDEMEDRA